MPALLQNVADHLFSVFNPSYRIYNTVFCWFLGTSFWTWYIDVHSLEQGIQVLNSISHNWTLTSSTAKCGGHNQFFVPVRMPCAAKLILLSQPRVARPQDQQWQAGFRPAVHGHGPGLELTNLVLIRYSHVAKVLQRQIPNCNLTCIPDWPCFTFSDHLSADQKELWSTVQGVDGLVLFFAGKDLVWPA